jgi:long-chain acyl-CoA synthetase
MIRRSAEGDVLASSRPSALSTLLDLYALRARLMPEEAAYWTQAPDGSWTPTTWGAFWESAQALAQAFRHRGLEPGMRVGLMLPTCLDWERFQLAVLLNGAVVIGLDGHDEPARRARMANMVVLDVLVVSSIIDAHAFGAEVLRNLSLVVVQDAGLGSDVPGDESLGTPPILSTQALLMRQSRQTLSSPTPDTLATIIFTSGSTGEPRAIGYTHAQVLCAVDAILSAYPEIRRGDRLVCWLPLSNLFQRVLNFCAAGCGANTWFVEDPRRIGELLPAIRPHVFIGVPRFYEKLQAGIMHSLGQRPRWVRWVAEWALSRPMAPDCQRESGPLDRIADRLVFRQIRAVLGGEIRFLVSGSAPFPGWLARWFERCGLPVLEAYGLSENVVPIALNTPVCRRRGSVGRVLAPNEVRLGIDGEVLVRGPGCAGTYLGESSSLLDAEGWLSTGDLGRFTDDGFLELIGRRVEVFKLSTGRKVAPTRVEAALCRSTLIDQAMVLGAAQKCTLAIVTLSPDATHLTREILTTRLVAEIPLRMADIEDWLVPAALLVRRDPFTIAGGELTANLKLRRPFIAEHHAVAVRAIYAGLESGETRLPEGDGWFAVKPLDAKGGA